MSSAGESEAGGIGFPNVCGFSPAIDLADNVYVTGVGSSCLLDFTHDPVITENSPSSSNTTNTMEEDPMVAFFQKFGLSTESAEKPKNKNLLCMLNVNTGDIRHILQTTSTLNRWNNEENAKSVEFHYMDTHPHHIARALQFWSLSHDQSVGEDGILDHAHAFLEIQSNLYLPTSTSQLLYQHIQYCLDAIEKRSVWKELYDVVHSQHGLIKVHNTVYNNLTEFYQAYQYTSFWLSSSIDWSYLREKDIVEVESILRKYIHVKKDLVSWEANVVEKLTSMESGYKYDISTLPSVEILKTCEHSVPRSIITMFSQFRNINMSNMSNTNTSTNSNVHQCYIMHTTTDDTSVPNMIQYSTDNDLVHSQPQLDLHALWEYRVRRYYADRYDHRVNLYDWDQNTKVQQSTGFLHSVYYKRYRETGMAYDYSHVSAVIPNNTLLTYTEGMEKKKGKIQINGYWGDILTGPYSAYAYESIHRDVYEHRSSQFLHSVLTVAETQVEELLRGIRHHRKTSLCRDMTVGYHEYKKNNTNNTVSINDASNDNHSTTGIQSITSIANILKVHPSLLPCYPSTTSSTTKYKLVLHPCDSLDRKSAFNKLKKNKFVRCIAGFSTVTKLELLNSLVQEGIVTMETIKYLPFTNEQRVAYNQRWTNEAQNTCHWTPITGTRVIPTFDEDEDEKVKSMYADQNQLYWTETEPNVILNSVKMCDMPKTIPSMCVYETCTEMIAKYKDSQYLYLPTFLHFGVKADRPSYTAPMVAATTPLPSATKTAVEIIPTDLHEALQATPLGPKHKEALVQLRTERLRTKEKRVTHVEEQVPNTDIQ